MAFAELSFDEQADLVSEVLQDLLGENPSKLDYIHLLRVTEAVIAGLREAIQKDLGIQGVATTA